MVAAFCFLWCPFLLSAVEQRIDAPLAAEIIDFSLYNFDNLLADSYEQNQAYIHYLAYLLHQATGFSKAEMQALILTVAILPEDNPPAYMLRLNKVLKNHTGYFYIDD